MFEIVQGSVKVLNIKKTRNTRGWLISGVGAYNWMNFYVPSRWAYNQGGSKPEFYGTTEEGFFWFLF